MKSLNKIVILNILSTFILQGIAFFSTPIFTRMLGASQFGLYSLINSWISILTCVMGLSIHSSIGTGYYTFKNDYVSFRNSILLLSSLIGLIEIIIILLNINIVSGYLGFCNEIIFLICINALCHYIVNFAQTTFIYEKKALSNFILSISISVSTVALSIILINQLSVPKKYIGRIYGMTIPYLIISVIVWSLLYLKRPIGIIKSYCKYAIKIGSPIVFHALSQNILGQSDRIMMQFIGIPASEVGIYSLFYSLCMVMSTILSALNNSWCPFYYDDISEGRWTQLNAKCKNYTELFSVLIIGFILISREVTYLMADETFWGGINIIPILIFAVYFIFMYQFPVNFEFFHKKTNIIAFGTICAGILNIILNAFMIPTMGIYGAALATTISYLGLFLMHSMILNRLKKYSYHIQINIFIPGLLSVIIASILFYVLAGFWYLRWAIGITLGCFELHRIYKRKTIF